MKNKKAEQGGHVKRIILAAAFAMVIVSAGSTYAAMDAVGEMEYVEMENSTWSAPRTRYPTGFQWEISGESLRRMENSFPCAVGAMMFGTDPYTWPRSYSMDHLEPGDIVCFNQSHSIIVTEVSGDLITYADCDSVSGKVCWDQTAEKEKLTEMYGALKFVMGAPAIRGLQ